MRSRVIIGLLFIILGVGFLLEKLDVVDFTDMLSDWWALIFVLIGLVQLLKRQRGSALPGLFFIVLGVVLLGKKVANINVLEYFWPILIIVLGFLFVRSEEHTSELQSRFDLVCRLLLVKKNSI